MKNSNSAHKHGDVFNYGYSMIPPGETKEKYFEICEKTYLTALGWRGVMPTQIRDAKRAIAFPNSKFLLEGRETAKSDHAAEYITNYRETACDSSAYGENENVRILPFAKITEFYREYEAEGLALRRLHSYARYDTFNNVYNERFRKTLRCMRCKGNHSTCDVRASVIAIEHC
jgi:hypothetical protein